MNSSKALSAGALAGVTPVMLFLATGIAQAEDIVCPGDARCATVSWDPSPGVGLVVHVVNNNSGRWQCNYSATPAYNPLNLGGYQHPFELAPPSADNQFPETSWVVTSFGGMPAVASGTEWNVVVSCKLAESGGTSTMTITTTKVF
jgi:hypothetical protein